MDSGFRITILDEEEKRLRTLETLRATFKPEFLNRIDDIITFSALTIDDIDKIIDIQIGLDSETPGRSETDPGIDRQGKKLYSQDRLQSRLWCKTPEAGSAENDS